MNVTGFGKGVNLFLEAEVPPKGQNGFEHRYKAATGKTVSPGSPPEYKLQRNKWGPELRIYFNDAAMAAILKALDMHVEGPRNGYRSGEYAFRVNNNDLWWKLVEGYGFELGLN